MRQGASLKAVQAKAPVTVTAHDAEPQLPGASSLVAADLGKLCRGRARVLQQDLDDPALRLGHQICMISS